MSHAWKAYGMGIPKEQALQGMGCLLRLANIWLTGRLNQWYPSNLFILPNAFIKDSLYMVSIRHKSWIHTSGWPISQSIYCSFSASAARHASGGSMPLPSIKPPVRYLSVHSILYTGNLFCHAEMIIRLSFFIV